MPVGRPSNVQPNMISVSCHFSKDMVAHLAAKYEPLANIFAAEYRSNPGIRLLVSEVGFAEIGQKIDRTRERLLTLVA